jgi:hypothetical protein
MKTMKKNNKNNKLKIIKYIFLLLITEIALLVVPFMMYNLSFDLDYICFTINAVLCWYYIKQIEKLYYTRYDKLSSMLYNICPLIGISLLLGLSYYITKEESILFLLEYYLQLFITIYLINLIYVIIKNINNK